MHPAFEEDGLLTMRLSLPRVNYTEAQDAAAFYPRLMAELASLPGVTRVRAISNLPMTDSQSNNGSVLEDFPLQPDELPPIVRTNYATPGYFEPLQIALREERLFEPRDHEQQTGTVIVSANFADQFWPEASAIGRRVTPGLPSEDARWYTIVGVVGDVRDDGLSAELPTMIYYPVVGLGGDFGDWVVRTMSVAIRTEVEPTSLAAAARQKVWVLDARLPLISMRTGAAIVAQSVARTSYTMILLAIAAGVALVLGAVGIYGVISYIVSQRTREIGIRMALGADRSGVSRMVVAQGMRIAAIGVAFGLVGAWAATLLMTALLFGVGNHDPATFAVLSLFLLGVAALASYIPARRAASVSPVRALHYE